jgi:hypothetical protein
VAQQLIHRRDHLLGRIDGLAETLNPHDQIIDLRRHQGVDLRHAIRLFCPSRWYGSRHQSGERPGGGVKVPANGILFFHIWNKVFQSGGGLNSLSPYWEESPQVGEHRLTLLVANKVARLHVPVKIALKMEYFEGQQAVSQPN